MKASSQVAERREAKGMSQYALAKEVGIQQSHLRKIETREIAFPGVDLAIRIADALGCDVRELFGAQHDLKAAS